MFATHFRTAEVANFERMWHWLMSLDPPTRAALIGGAATMLSVFGALLGVYANLAWNRKQHRDEKSYNLRRDVYLDTIASINGALASLSERAVPKNLSKDDNQAKGDTDQQLFGACAKVHVLGGKRVLAAVIAFESAFGRWSKKLMRHQTLYEQTGSRRDENLDQIKRLADLVKAFTTERAEVIQSIKQFDPKSTDPEARKTATAAVDAWKNLPAQGAELRKQLDSMAEAVKTFARERFQLLSDSVNYILEVQKDLSPLVDEIIIAMKSELGLRVDECWYRGKVTVALQESLGLIAQLIETHPAVKELKAKLEEPLVSLSAPAREKKNGNS